MASSANGREIIPLRAVVSEAQETDAAEVKRLRAATPVKARLPLNQLVAERFARDSYASAAVVEIMDRAARATLGRATAGISPAALAAAYFDWATHLAFSPGKQLQLARKAWEKYARFMSYAVRCGLSGGGAGCCIEPLPQDRRFRSEAWQNWPFNLLSQAFLLNQQWWHNATTGVRGVTDQHERALEFVSRQMLDVVSPSNFVFTNPDVLEKTLAEGGLNLVRGFHNFVEDRERSERGKPPVGAEAFKAGESVAVTPGAVVFRNRLIELIQYAPTTGEVHAEPVLIVPAWIMKYYVLDLSPENSLVKHLVGKGNTVFMISWKNPGPEERDVSFDDYLKLGVMAALDAVGAIAPDRKIHGAGYCLGGTLLGIAAAAMERVGDDRFKSLTFLASLFDFTDAGELSLFINESQVAFLEDVMWEQGFLDTKQMAGAFQLLRSNDLIWSRIEHDYLMGERRPMTDLTAWNADATRMPYKMHSEYLRRLYLKNDFAEGRYTVDGEPISLHDIRVPMFVVATTRDHVAPWRSVFKIHMLADTEVTFLLTSGGHNAGIISEPGRPGRSYRIKTTRPDGLYFDADQWSVSAEAFDGAWWPAWTDWLADRSDGVCAPPKPEFIEVMPGRVFKTDRSLVPAPGAYVLES